MVLIMVNLMVRTPELIVSFGFFTFSRFFGIFSLFSACIQIILVCKPLDIIYACILQFIRCSTKLVESQMMEKTDSRNCG